MNSKQRAHTAINLSEPDRVPIDYWADNLITEKLIGKLGLKNKEELLQYFNVDFRYIEGAKYIGPDLNLNKGDSWKDIFGVIRKKILFDVNNPGKGSYSHSIFQPLASIKTIKGIEDYEGWPSTEIYDYSQVEASADVYSNYAIICGGDRLNRTAQLKPSIYLRGLEQIMIDLAINPEIVEAINERLVNFYLEHNRKIFSNAHGKIDIFFMGDDFGTQNGLFISNTMWKKFYKPGFKKFIDLAHHYGIKVMHHTCGNITDLIPDFIECGLDILQSLQPGAMSPNFKKIKKEFGRYICFQGGIDIQNTMPFGSTEDIEREVSERIRNFAPGGGYIICTAHNMLPDTPLENVLALYRSALVHGKY
jgi:uroporphyrinogen decarboxylase